VFYWIIEGIGEKKIVTQEQKDAESSISSSHADHAEYLKAETCVKTFVLVVQWQGTQDATPYS
jgi:hypothetical protein